MLSISRLLFGLVFTLGGAVNVYYGGKLAIEAAETSSWQAVPGEITRSTVTYRPGFRGGSYSADIEYAYEVGSIQFLGTRIGPTQVHGSASLAQESASRFPNGSKVVVHFDPSNPGSAVLDPGLNLWIATWPVLAALLMLVGIATLTAGGRARAPTYAPGPGDA